MFNCPFSKNLHANLSVLNDLRFPGPGSSSKIFAFFIFHSLLCPQASGISLIKLYLTGTAPIPYYLCPADPTADHFRFSGPCVPELRGAGYDLKERAMPPPENKCQDLPLHLSSMYQTWFVLRMHSISPSKGGIAGLLLQPRRGTHI